MSDAIKSMQLYPRADRILADLRAAGFADDVPLPRAVVSRFDQLHYHGTDALDAAIAACGIAAGDRVLEIGSGWGGCARHIAGETGAAVTAVELQADYDAVARDLTARCGLSDRVAHERADFLTFEPGEGAFDHAVSWLALFHIPRRPDYLARTARALRPGGMFFAEDLYLVEPPDADEEEDFQRHLFPNSLVRRDVYRQGLEDSGFEIVQFDDMTADWSAFTAERLTAFRANRAAYTDVHGEDGYATIETFYDKMAGYFARGLVGGIRFAARRR